MIYINKSKTIPDSLAVEQTKASGEYNKLDVLEQLKKDFFNKCYICEHDKPTNINVEHFTAHKGNNMLKFKWGNLYYSCGHCNNTKLAKYDNILNCTLKEDDVENSIKLYMDPFPKKNVSVAPIKADEKTLNTVEFLDKVYNGVTPTKRLESSNLREYLLNELMDFQRAIYEYYEAEKFQESEEMEIWRKKIKRHLHDASAFTSFKRWIIKDSVGLSEDFGELLGDRITI